MKKILLIALLLVTFPILAQTYLPDNIIETDCNAPLEGSPWDIHLLGSSANNDAASYAPVLVGDINGDGVTDIVVAQYNSNNYRSRTINVYSGIDLSLQHSFAVTDTIYLSNGPYAIGRYPKPDGTLQGAIFVHCCDKRIRAYTIEGTLLNVSDQPTSCDGMVSLADFNGDGYPEVYAGSDIFDAATMKWLCSGPAYGNKGLSYRGTPFYSNGTYHHTYYAMSLASNVLGDAKQELICGNTIYNVNITSRTNPSLNSVTEAKTITPPGGFSADGHVSLADFDLDGECEVLVIRDNTDDQHVDDIYFYAYKPSNGQIIFQTTNRCASSSYVFIGNIDAEPHPEIIFLENQPNGSLERIFCLRYTPQNGLGTIWWQYHDDRSGMTAMTLFDFNHDGIMELVYRDNNNLRIINASGLSHITGNDTIRPYDIYNRQIAAGTGCEYPTVADINGDGKAEIVVTGMLDQYSSIDLGYGGLHAFGCPSWTPSRKVWNQYMYHVTNVNEDLTIPTYCFNTATVFTAPDGTERRPYNNFLQQATYINQYGEQLGVIDQTQYFDIYQELVNSYAWNGIVYTQPGDYTQQFIDQYGCDSIVTLHLYLSQHPDNILETDCNTPLEGFEWGIREDWSSSDNIYCRILPLVGDLDDDGIPEIVCFDMQGNSSSQTAAKIINVYDGRSKAMKAQISVDALVWAHGNGPFGLVKLPNRKGLIVAACKDTRLRAYDITSANPSTPVWVSNESYNTGYNDFSVSIGFTDFNGDGYPEIYVRNKIFDAETGTLLAVTQGGSNQADSYSHGSHTNHNKLSCPIAADMDEDGLPELILGNEIYKVGITNRHGTEGNHATLSRSIAPPAGVIADGNVQVADFNLDGHLDIFISNRDTESYSGTVSFYVWDVFHNTTSAPIQLSTNMIGKSIPLVSDWDNDGLLEILIDCCHDSSQGLRAYRFNPNTNSFNYLWSLPIDEDSYSNTATLFDFNADGRNELLFTDNSDLFVYDLGTTPPALLSQIDCGEITIMHVPVVADVDADGSAEIIVTGKAGGYMQANTMLKVYKSSTQPWRNARKVWNQYMYHVTNVNEDLTIPAYCFNNATTFIGLDGVARRPYNNFLQQAGYITPTGEPYHPGGTTEVDVYGASCSTYSFHGITYTQSGHYEQLVESQSGCDTLYSIYVNIGETLYHSMSETACDSYTWNGATYTQSGTYVQTFTSADGCDSIVSLSLTIKPTPYVSPIHGESFIYYKDNGEFVYSIDPVEGCLGYEWHIDNGWTLTSSNDSPECVLNIDFTSRGTLTVRVYTECGFVERSLTIDHDTRPWVVVYPNPNSGEFNIGLYGMKGEAVIEVFNYLGQRIGSFSVDTDIDGTVIPYSLQGKAAGVYILAITHNYQLITKKVVKTTPAMYGVPKW